MQKTKIRCIKKQKNFATIGIGALIIFIAMVLVAGMAASVLIETANKVEIKATETGQDTTIEVSTGIRLIDIEGQKKLQNIKYNRTTNMIWNSSGRNDGTPVGGDGTVYMGWYNNSRIYNITFTITPWSGSKQIDLSHVYIIISNSTTQCVLNYDSTQYTTFAGENGVFSTNTFDLSPTEFGVIVLEDADNSCTQNNPIINRGDIIMITVNTSSCFFGLPERTTIFGGFYPEFGKQTYFSVKTPGSYDVTIYDLYVLN